MSGISNFVGDEEAAAENRAVEFESDWIQNHSLTQAAKLSDYKVTVKYTNPKESVGIKKIPLSTISAPVIAEVGVAMMEGARKYARHNYRISGLKASVYYDATFRHMSAWWEGEDTDPESGLSHITKAIAGLICIRDSMIQGKFVDDRPPASPKDWQIALQPVIDDLFKRHPVSKEAYTELNKNEHRPSI